MQEKKFSFDFKLPIGHTKEMFEDFFKLCDDPECFGKMQFKYNNFTEKDYVIYMQEILKVRRELQKYSSEKTKLEITDIKVNKNRKN